MSGRLESGKAIIRANSSPNAELFASRTIRLSRELRGMPGYAGES
jgi:hypothetical protein